ncbi:hypothetical protein E1B28_009584 [Marasmius oreades]|uniref:F-box domain-containing protein n=1 Tax=Marasmius oreades TaxID=181124 RepID=A0A9P7USS4_9AGAR|nr:uncharacterized protein E1B28_009584 [Marasmius oreades]KAG7090469.1 hypothetical protein E1B28_009584 [Marasmius oreades]
MFSILPPELVLSVFSYLPIPAIHSLQLASKEYDTFIRTNQSTIYHHAAVVHGFISSTAVGFDQLSSSGYSFRMLDGLCSSWKAFCRRHTQQEKSWKGKGPSRVVSYTATGTNVHRIKVDERNRFVIASTGLRQTQNPVPALIVSDMKDTDKILWSLPSTYIKEYAHIEYQNGYLIFDRLGDRKEVWRLATLKDPSPLPPDIDVEKPPIPYAQKQQLVASLEAATAYAHTYPHGHFVPHALLEMPSRTRAFRFFYPTLLVGGYDHAFCYDVPTRKLVQTVSSVQTPQVNGERLATLGDLNYVEVSPRHVFICGEHSLRVFSRESGGCVFDMPSTAKSYARRTFRVLGVGKDADDELVARDRLEVYSDRERGSWDLVGINQGMVASLKTVEVEPEPEPEDHRMWLDEFVAVHVSACGNHLVALLSSSRIVIVRNFLLIPLSSVQAQKESSIQVDFGTQYCAARYLTFEKGRVVCASSVGLFIVDVNEILASPSLTSSELQVQVYRIPEFNVLSLLSRVSCLQLSDSGLYLTWRKERLRTRIWNGRGNPSEKNGDFNAIASVEEPGSDAEDVPMSASDDSHQDTFPLCKQLEEEEFFETEVGFRMLMESEGTHLILPNGDMFVSTISVDAGDELEELESNCTVCGVDFAVWEPEEV